MKPEVLIALAVGGFLIWKLSQPSPAIAQQTVSSGSQLAAPVPAVLPGTVVQDDPVVLTPEQQATWAILTQQMHEQCARDPESCTTHALSGLGPGGWLA